MQVIVSKSVGSTSAISFVLLLLVLAPIASASPLLVSPETLDAGELAPGETVGRAFEIENTGTEAVAFEFPGFAGQRSVSADLEVGLAGESFIGLEFRSASDGPLSGDWTGFTGALELLAGDGDTWTNDLAILLTETPEFNPASVVYQVGGNSGHFAPINQTFPWPGGIGNEPIDASLEFPEPITVDGLYAWVGNAWIGGQGTWTGSVTLFGLGGQTGLISSINPSSGELAAGDSLPVEAVFDAGTRVPGQYEELLILTTDQPDQPELAIPVSAAVLGQVELAPLPASIDFGAVVVGTVERETLVIENAGNEPLLIEAISADGAAFSASAEALEIAPFSSADLVIEFAPGSAVESSGVLSFVSNEPATPEVQIDLIGFGIAAPTIALDPASAELALEAGTQGSVSFDIANAGEGPLNFEIPAFATQAAASTPVERSMIAARTPTRTSQRLEPAANHPNWQPGAAVNSRSDAGFSLNFDSFSAEAGNFEVLAGPLSGDLSSFVADFVLDSSNGAPLASDLTLLVASTPTPDLDAGHDVLIQIGGIAGPIGQVFAFWGTGNSPEPGTVVEAMLQADVPIPLEEVYILLGNGGFQGSGVWSGSIDILDLAPEVGPIVGVNPSLGTVAPGESVTVQVDVSAIDLVQGVFPGRVQILSNDPVRPNELFDLTLEVSGTPALTLPAPALDFGDLFIGQTGTEELPVINSGSAPLTLSGFQVDDSRFDVASDAVSIAPGASGVVPVAFTADLAGDVSATLSFDSDDPNNAEVSISLSATILETPALVVDPVTIDAALAAGNSTTVSLNLSNPGTGLLAFEFPDFQPGDDDGAGSVGGAAAEHAGLVSIATGDVDSRTADRVSGDDQPDAAPLSGRSASFEITLDAFEAFGGEFVPVATDLSGALERIDADFVLEQATGLTWANDLALVITSGPELAPDSIVLQVGGTLSLSQGGLRFGWGMGSSSEPGTVVQTSIALDEALELDGAIAWVGNAWAAHDSGQWSGTIGLDGASDGTPFITGVGTASGEIAGGESTTVDVTLSALDLIAGSYRDRLRLTSNDPVNPVLEVLADLDVTGEPQLLINPESIDFGTVFTGATEIASLVLSNPGTDVLLIDRVQASGEGFSVAEDSFSVEPGASAVLAVEFFSETTGGFAGQLEVTNNASDATAIVELNASVEEPGILTVSATEVVVEVASGATSQASLTLGNIGASPLAFEAASQSGTSAPTGLAPSVRPALMMAPPHPIAIPMPNNDGPSIGTLEDRDVLWEQSPNGSFGVISTRSTELDAGLYVADDFEINGAALVQGLAVQGFRFDGGGRFDEVFESVVFYLYDDEDGKPAGSPDDAEGVERFRFEAAIGAPGFEVDEETTGSGHRADVSLDLEVAIGEGLLLPDGHYWLVVHAVSASPELISDTWAVLTSLDGNQSAQLIDANDFFGLGATTWQPLSEIIAPEVSNLAFRIEGQALSFLALAPTQGVIEVDQNQELQLAFDATDFQPGSYATVLSIRTNSPATPEVEIPVTMVVEAGEPGLNWVNLAGPSNAEIITGQNFTIHGSARLSADRLHDFTQVEMWVGFRDHDSHPALWPESAWVGGTMLSADDENADFYVESGAHLPQGQYRYATRFQLADGSYVYGGYHESGGGFWDGLLHVSGVLNVLDADADRLFRDRFQGY